MKQFLHFIAILIILSASIQSYGQTVDTIFGCDEIPSIGFDTDCTMCSFDILYGTSAGFTASPAAGWCGSVENDQYIGFVIGPTGTLVFEMQTFNCLNGNGLEVGIYDQHNNLVGDCFNLLLPGFPQVFTADGLIPGTLYYIRIDGFDADHCEFNIQIISGLNSVGPGAPGAILGPSSVCWDETDERYPFFIDPIPNATSYYWRLTPGIWTADAIIKSQRQLDSTEVITTNPIIDVEVKAMSLDMPSGTCDTLLLEVLPLTPCFASSETSQFHIQVCRPSQDTTFASIPCLELPYEFPLGSGDYYNSLFEFLTIEVGTTVGGCDSFGVLYIDMPIPGYNPIINNIILCEGEIANLCGFPDSTISTGHTYCEYPFASLNGCDSIAYFYVQYLNPEANIEVIQGAHGDTLHAVSRTGSIPPSTVGDSISYAWINSAGEILADTEFIVVNEPGDYTLEVSMFSHLDSTILCNASTTITTSTTNTIDNLPEGAALAVYPNPVEAFINWEISGLSKSISLEVTIKDAVGKTFWSEQYQGHDSFRQNLSIEDWPNGVYTITFCGEDFMVSRKLITQ